MSQEPKPAYFQAFSKIRTGVIAALAGLLLLVPNAGSRAQEEPEPPPSEPPAVEILPQPDDTITFLPEGDARFYGMYAEQSFPFHLPEDWTLSLDANLWLEVEHSELIKDSSLTVSINGAPLSSHVLPLEGASGLLKMPVPVRNLRIGWNTIAIRFHLRIHDDPCKDLENPGLWATVLDRSFLEVPHIRLPAEPDLSRFPGSYVQPSLSDEGEGPQVCFLLPADYTPAILETSAVLAARIGQSRAISGNTLAAYLLEGHKTETLPDANLIFVGLASQLKSLRSVGIDPTPYAKRYKALSTANERASRYAVILEAQSPFSEYKRILIVVARDNRSMRVLRANIGHGSFADGLSGSTQAYLADPPPENAEPIDESIVTLDSLNLKDITVRGLSARSARVRIPVPRHWRLTEEARLQLHIDHSISLRRSSSFEVAINGSPAYALEIAPEIGPHEARTMELVVPIPANQREARVLDVKFELFLDVGSDDCSRPYDDSAWVVVRNDSHAYLAHETRHPVELTHYPDVLSKGGHLAKLGLVMGIDAGRAELTALLATASVLGSRLPAKAPIDLMATKWEFLEGKAQSMGRGRDWVVAGPANLAAFLRRVSGNLPAPLNAEGHLGVSFRHSNPMPEETSQLGILQIMRSPWDPERTVLLATAHAPAGMMHIARILGEPWPPALLEGNVALITDADTAYHYHVPMKAPVTPDVAEPERSKSRWLWLIISLTAFLIALLVYRATTSKKQG